MRVSFLALMGCALIQAADARASDGPAGATEIVLTPAAQAGNLSGIVSGTTEPDKPATFFVRSPARRDITIKVAADNGPCGFEMRRGSSSGFQSDVSRFPATRTFNAQEGEVFTFSFFQTRTAFVERKGCSFSLSVN